MEKCFSDRQEEIKKLKGKKLIVMIVEEKISSSRSRKSRCDSVDKREYKNKTIQKKKYKSKIPSKSL